LHSEGWSITSIAAYMQTTRPTIYTTLQRWKEEQFASLEEKSRARKQLRKDTLQLRNEIRKLQENSLLGEYRVHTALLRMGIEGRAGRRGPEQGHQPPLYGEEKKTENLPPPKKGRSY